MLLHYGVIHAYTLELSHIHVQCYNNIIIFYCGAAYCEQADRNLLALAPAWASARNLVTGSVVYVAKQYTIVNCSCMVHACL